MNEVITIGLDLAKNVFQIHGVDASGESVIRRQLRRRYVLSFLKKAAPDSVSELSADEHATFGVNAVDLKYVLRKIKTDCDNFVHGRLLFPRG